MSTASLNESTDAIPRRPSDMGLIAEGKKKKRVKRSVKLQKQKDRQVEAIFASIDSKLLELQANTALQRTLVASKQLYSTTKSVQHLLGELVGLLQQTTANSNANTTKHTLPPQVAQLQQNIDALLKDQEKLYRQLTNGILELGGSRTFSTQSTSPSNSSPIAAAGPISDETQSQLANELSSTSSSGEFRKTAVEKHMDRESNVGTESFSNLTTTTSMSLISSAAHVPALEEDGHPYESMVQNWEIDDSELEIDENKLLGRGQYGEVFQATYHGIEVAVKILQIKDAFRTPEEKQSFIDSFRRECAIMRKMVHPNILLFLGASTSNPEKLALVTEMMPYGSVANLIHPKKSKDSAAKTKHKKITFHQKVQWMIDTARGMNWLHKSRPVFIHADLKPANLLVDRNMTVKVGDFGLTQMKERHNRELSGTPAYVAPEILRKADCDEKVDVYSYGVCLWEIYTEKVPYEDEGPKNPLALMNAVVSGKRPTIPPDCPPSLKKLIEKCWADNPAHRPSFEKILSSSVFASMLIEASFSPVNFLGKRFWSQAFRELQRVSWPVFEAAFRKFCGLTPRTFVGDFQAIGVPLECVKGFIIDRQGFVAMESFAALLEWFGPLEKGIDFLRGMMELLKQKWFHADIPLWYARAMMSSQPRGNFLIRMRNPPGDFEMVVATGREGDSCSRYRIYHRAGDKYRLKVGARVTLDCDDLPDAVRKASAMLKLKKPCEGSKFQPLFAQRQSLIGTRRRSSIVLRPEELEAELRKEASASGADLHSNESGR